MLRAFRECITPIVMTTALLCAACAESSEPSAIGSASASSEMDSLVQDADLLALLTKASAVTKTATGKINGASDEQREQWRSELAQLQVDLESADPNQSIAFPALITELTGLTQHDVSELTDDARVLTERYPSIAGYPAQFGEATQMMLFTMEYELIPHEECDTEVCQCLDECDDEYRAAVNKGGVFWLAEVWTLELEAIVLGTANFLDSMSEAYEALQECREKCTGEPQEECQNDSDCPDDMFCAKPIGNPVNYCRSKKDEGKVCSGDNKCASGCCKYHFFSNPFSMVCRPADKCD